LVHKDDPNQLITQLFTIPFKKIPCNSEKEAVLHIYRQLSNAEPPDEETARDVIDKLFFSDKRYDLGEVGRYRINKKLLLNTDMKTQKSLLKKTLLKLSNILSS
jgi:DNA-directed RNA polymerase subunit beta